MWGGCNRVRRGRRDTAGNYTTCFQHLEDLRSRAVEARFIALTIRKARGRCLLCADVWMRLYEDEITSLEGVG